MAELAHLLSACVLRAVQALPPRDLLLIFEPGQGGPGASDEDPGPPPRLRLSADPSSPRLHLQHTRVPGHDGPAGPFYLLLEEHLAGATLASISQVRGDRIVLLEFRDTPLGGRRALLAELTGRGANIFLLGPGDRLESSLAPLPSPPPDSTRRQRLLSPGQPWTPPTAPPPPSGAGTQSLAQALAEDLPGPPEEPPSGRGAPRTPAPLSWLVELVLGTQAQTEHSEQLSAATRRRLDRRLRRTRSRLQGLARRSAAAAGAERARQDGDLLQANLHRLRRGLTQIVVDDLYAAIANTDAPDAIDTPVLDGPGDSDALGSSDVPADSNAAAPQRTLELDGRLSPQQNVERYYKRHAKLQRDGRTVQEERQRLEATAAALEEYLRRLAEDENCDAAALDQEAVAAGLLDAPQEADPRRRQAPKARLPYRTYRAGGGSEIRVGRSARDNDTLTLRHCRGNDLWLHTADAPGSHVVLVGQRGCAADAEEILDAAHLAIHFSPLAGARKADVHVAQRKYVHKPRRAKPGLVTLSGGKLLQVRVEEGRLERLLRGQGT